MTTGAVVVGAAVVLGVVVVVAAGAAVGGAVLGGAVGVVGGDGSVAPAGRQMSSPGYSGVSTVARLTCSSFAKVMPAASATRIQ